VAVAGAVTVWLCGWVLIEGGPPRATIKPAARRTDDIFITLVRGFGSDVPTKFHREWKAKFQNSFFPSWTV
jgi:hypothetical protein